MTERGEAIGKQIIVAWATERKATHKDVRHLQSDHKEAVTKIILHALDVTADGVTELSMYSSDTDVVMLAIRCYPEMCLNTSFGTTHRIGLGLGLQPIVETLGSATLPAFQAIPYQGLITRVVSQEKRNRLAEKNMKRPMRRSFAS